MTKEEKKQIYEYVMNIAARFVKKNLMDSLNEGAWGYEPNQNDGALDVRGDIFLSICELVYDKCEERIKKGTDYAWEGLGNVEYFFEELANMPDFGIGDKNFEKYYYWWRLRDVRHKNIVELYEKLLKQCKSDKDWISGWDEPEKMEKSLEKREKNLEKYQKLLTDNDEYEKEMERMRKEDKLKDAEESKI